MRQWFSPRVLVFACLAVGVARIVSTYHVFNQTWDEPAHVARWMTAFDTTEADVDAFAAAVHAAAPNGSPAGFT